MRTLELITEETTDFFLCLTGGGCGLGNLQDIFLSKKKKTFCDRREQNFNFLVNILLNLKQNYIISNIIALSFVFPHSAYWQRRL